MNNPTGRPRQTDNPAQPVVDQPPEDHNDPAEKALLGAMLLSPPAVAAAIAHLNPADLYRPHHQTIWTAIVEAPEWGDIILVEAELRRRRQITKIGGPTYLTDLIRACPIPGPDHIGHYARIITEAAQTRRRRTLTTQLSQAVDDPQTWAKLLTTINQPHPNGTGKLRVTTATTLTPRQAHWLDNGQRIPTNAITLLAGREGIGKTTIAYDLIAKLTQGKLGHPTPRAAAICASEDAWHEVVIPRLIAAGADLARVYRIDSTTPDGATTTITTPSDLPELETLCPELDIALLLIDPIMSVIHASLDTHKDREVRQALDPLTRFATTTGTSVIATIHANKTSTTDPGTTIMGSRAFPAVARSVLYAITDPQTEREDRYLLGHIKCNQGPKQPTLRYHLITVTLDQWDITTSRVVWDQQDDRSISEVMATPRQRVESEPAQRVLNWLTKQGPHPVSTSEIVEAFPDMKRNAVERLLSRLVDRGQIVRPIYGHYRSIQ